MEDDYSSYDDDDDYGYEGRGRDSSCSGSDDDGSSLEDCNYCRASYKRRNRERHMENVHKYCKYCENYMKKSAFEAHVRSKHTVPCQYCNKNFVQDEINAHKSTHFIKCQYCNENIRKENVDAHTAERHPSPTGMIRNIGDSEFNRLITENRVYAKDGLLYFK